MKRFSAIKSIASGLLAAAAVAAVVSILLAGSSGAGDEPGPEIVGIENACKGVSPPGAHVARVVYGKGSGGNQEMTVWDSDGSYHVTRCTETGDLVVRQHVVPVRTPDGLKMLVTETTTPTESISGLLPADFAETPQGIAVWKEVGERMLAQTLPPTSEPGKTTDVD